MGATLSKIGEGCGPHTLLRAMGPVRTRGSRGMVVTLKSNNRRNFYKSELLICAGVLEIAASDQIAQAEGIKSRVRRSRWRCGCSCARGEQVSCNTDEKVCPTLLTAKGSILAILQCRNETASHAEHPRLRYATHPSAAFEKFCFADARKNFPQVFPTMSSVLKLRHYHIILQ